MKGVCSRKRLVLVMDKGFYSEKNVKTLLTDYNDSEFLIAIPFTTGIANELVKAERKTIECAANSIKTSSSPIRGVSRQIEIGEYSLFAHIFYNPEKELSERNDLYEHINRLKEMIEAGKVPGRDKKETEKYLTTARKRKPEITIKQDVIEKELCTAGWMVVIGNGERWAQSAHDIYRKKDVVEKAYMKYKNMLGMNRLRVHNDERARNKNLVAFISLVLVSYIHNVIKQHDLYRKMTMEKMIITMSKMKIITINGHQILRPLTKAQQDILKAFSIPIPHVG